MRGHEAMAARCGYFLTMLFIVGAATFAQKAWEIVEFKGSSADFDVTLNLVVDQVSASDAVLLDKQTGRKIPLHSKPEAGEPEMEFVSGDEEKDPRLVVDVSPEQEGAPTSLPGRIVSGDKEQRVTLTRTAD